MVEGFMTIAGLAGGALGAFLATCALGLLLMAPMILTTRPSLGGQGVVELADRLYPVLNRLGDHRRPGVDHQPLCRTVAMAVLTTAQRQG